jgi:hypothetical protein
VIAREASSTSGDCVDYDNLMDFKTVRTIEIINGYPDNWYFNFDYYNDYDIKIKSPKFDTALTLPIGFNISAVLHFRFIYPASINDKQLKFSQLSSTTAPALCLMAVITQNYYRKWRTLAKLCNVI